GSVERMRRLRPWKRHSPSARTGLCGCGLTRAGETCGLICALPDLSRACTTRTKGKFDFEAANLGASSPFGHHLGLTTRSGRFLSALERYRDPSQGRLWYGLPTKS